MEGNLKLKCISYLSVLSLRNAWDNYNGQSAYLFVSLRRIVSQHRLYQPVKRYSMPILYSVDPLPDVYHDGYKQSLREDVQKIQQQTRQGWLANRVIEEIE